MEKNGNLPASSSQKPWSILITFTLLDNGYSNARLMALVESRLGKFRQFGRRSVLAPAQPPASEESAARCSCLNWYDRILYGIV